MLNKYLGPKRAGAKLTMTKVYELYSVDDIFLSKSVQKTFVIVLLLFLLFKLKLVFIHLLLADSIFVRCVDTVC